MATCTPDAYIGEIRMWAGNYAPLGWAFCNGTFLTVTENQALFSLIGTFYGGDGRTSFALPDLRGRAAMGFGAGPGLVPYPIGARAGQETVTLTLAQMPPHNHPMRGNSDAGTSFNVSGRVVSKTSTDTDLYTTPTDSSSIVQMADDGIDQFGAGYAHENRQAYQAVSFIIAIDGLYPNRN